MTQNRKTDPKQPPSPQEEAIRTVGNAVKRLVMDRLRQLSEQQQAAIHWRVQCDLIDIDVLIQAELAKANTSHKPIS